mmetsp:Transcript_594/g.1411  ORF Transcript_594/g.1411 Transcript_594/m.1411 type:complete len:299 (-) Transcript_594:2477-3373(-)
MEGGGWGAVVDGHVCLVHWTQCSCRHLVVPEPCPAAGEVAPELRQRLLLPGLQGPPTGARRRRHTHRATGWGVHPVRVARQVPRRCSYRRPRHHPDVGALVQAAAWARRAASQPRAREPDALPLGDGARPLCGGRRAPHGCGDDGGAHPALGRRHGPGPRRGVRRQRGGAPEHGDAVHVGCARRRPHPRDPHRTRHLARRVAFHPPHGHRRRGEHHRHQRRSTRQHRALQGCRHQLRGGGRRVERRDGAVLAPSVQRAQDHPRRDRLRCRGRPQFCELPVLQQLRGRGRAGLRGLPAR